MTSEDNSPFLGCYGNTFATTPNLDRLASEDFYIRMPMTTTRCMLLLFAYQKEKTMGKRKIISLIDQGKFINQEVENGADPGISTENMETIEVSHD